jgi:hypothetical protein
MSDNLSNTTWPDENIFTFEDPLSDPTALQSAHNILQKQVVNLQTKNEQWIKLFKQVEKGMSIKLAELDSLTKENRNLKVLPFSMLLNCRLRILDYYRNSNNVTLQRQQYIPWTWSSAFDSWKIKSVPAT